MPICTIAYHFLPNVKQTLTKFPKTFKKLPKWKHFATSSHTVHKMGSTNTSHLNLPSLLFMLKVVVSKEDKDEYLGAIDNISTIDFYRYL